MLYFFLSYCGIYPLQGVLPSNRAVALVSPLVLDEAVQCFLEHASLRQYLRSLIFLIGFQLLDFLFKESGSIHVFDAAIRSGNNNVGMPHDLIYKIIWRPVTFSHD